MFGTVCVRYGAGAPPSCRGGHQIVQAPVETFWVAGTNHWQGPEDTNTHKRISSAAKRSKSKIKEVAFACRASAGLLYVQPPRKNSICEDLGAGRRPHCRAGYVILEAIVAACIYFLGREFGCRTIWVSLSQNWTIA